MMTDDDIGLVDTPSASDESGRDEGMAHDAVETPMREGQPSDQAPLARGGQHSAPDVSGVSSGDNIPDESGSAPTFSDELLRRAAEYGYSPDDVKAWGDEAAIETVLREQDRLAFQQWQRFGGGQQYAPPQQMPMPQQMPYPQMVPPYVQQYAPPGYPGAVQPPPGQPPQPHGQQPFPGQYAVDLDPNDGYDERLVQHMHGMSQHYAQQIAALQQQFQQAMGAVGRVFQEQQQAESQQRLFGEYDQFDKLIESLGPEYQAVFGKGNWQTIGLPTGSPFGRNRAEVFNRMRSLRDFYAQRGGYVPDDRRLLDMAAEDALQGQWSLLKQRVGRNGQGRTGQAISRPRGATAGRQPQGSDSAASFAENFFKSRGFETRDVSRAVDEQIGL